MDSTPDEEGMSQERLRLLSAATACKRYPVEAYEFLCQSLMFTQEALDRVPASNARLEEAVDKHVSGEELLEGVRRFALDQFGPMAYVVFHQWGIKTTADFGNMVFHLIDSGVWFRSETDQVEDFHDRYDFERAFVHESTLDWDEFA
jgi:uncharacterized repeat protein (TIGR04138 family)